MSFLSLLSLLGVASVIALSISVAGAVALGKGPSTMWSLIMFAGLVASYVGIGAVLLITYEMTGRFYPILAGVPVAMTVAALRAFKQSRAQDASAK